jgi:hypothetical protein
MGSVKRSADIASAQGLHRPAGKCRPDPERRKCRMAVRLPSMIGGRTWADSGQHSLLLVQDLGIADRQRDRPLADAACHDRDHDEKEGVVGAEPEGYANSRARGLRQ